MGTVIRKAGSKDWADTGYWNTGAIPTDGDDVVIGDGGDIIDTGVSQSAVDLKSLKVYPGFRGSVLGLEIDIDDSGGGLLEYSGTGERFEVVGTIAKLVHKPSNARTIMRVFGSSAVTLAEIVAGVLIFEGGATPATLKQFGGDLVLLWHASNAPTNIVCSAGRAIIHRGWTSLVVKGTADVTFDGHSGTNVITGGTVQLDGGRFRWKSGNLGQLTLNAGEFDYHEIKQGGYTAGNVTTNPAVKEVKPINPSLEPTFGSVTEAEAGGSTVIKL